MTISGYLKLTLFLLIGITGMGALVGVSIRDRIHRDAYGALQHQKELTNLLSQVESGILLALDAENRFLLRYPVEGLARTAVYRQQAVISAEQTRSALKDIVRLNQEAGQPPSNPFRETLEGQLSLFEVELKRVVRLIQHKGDAKTGLVGEMKRMADGLNGYLDKLIKAPVISADGMARHDLFQFLTKQLLQIRNGEKEYLLWRNRDVLVPANRRVAQMEQALSSAPVSELERQRILTYLHTYMIYFERVALHSVQLFTELDRTTSIADQLQQTLSKYNASEHEQLQQVEADAWQRAHDMSLWLLMGMLAVLMVATVLAVRVTQRISGRLYTLVEATKQFGERGEVAPIVMNTKDEFAALADAFNGMVAKLSEAQLQLVHSEKLVATGKLSASIAHEINNPLFGIQGCLERILKRLPEDDSDHRLVSLAMRESQRIARLVEGLRDYHRPSDQTMAQVDLLAVFDDVALINTKYLQKHHVVLKRTLPNTLPKVKGTRDQLQMVFVNLMTNAVEAMPDGGTLTLEAKLDGDVVLLRFSDTGVGIEPGALGRLFEPFFSTKPEVKGVGLGLSISYGIIKRHGGEIKVSSEPGRTDFVVVLPLWRDSDVPSMSIIPGV